MTSPTNQTTSQTMPLAVQVKGSGLPILCLHGHPGSAASMDVFTNPLAEQYQTITPDLRGYGNSQVNQAFTMEQHLTDLGALLEHFHIQKCVILGWSLGGILAMELALRYPHRVVGLILVATAAYPRGTHPPITWQDYAYTGATALGNWLFPGWPWMIQHLGKPSLFRYLIQQHTPATYRYLATYAVPAFWQTSQFANRALNDVLRHGYDRRQAIKAIQCPSLLLIGDSDRHISPSSSVETAQILKNCQYHIYPQTAHLLPWERPEQILQDITSWLTEHLTIS